MKSSKIGNTLLPAHLNEVELDGKMQLILQPFVLRPSKER
jgi:hypothetical protein